MVILHFKIDDLIAKEAFILLNFPIIWYLNIDALSVLCHITGVNTYIMGT